VCVDGGGVGRKWKEGGSEEKVGAGGRGGGRVGSGGGQGKIRREVGKEEHWQEEGGELERIGGSWVG